MQEGVHVGVENIVELFGRSGIPVAAVLADGEYRRAVDADVNSAVVLNGGGEQLIPSLALGGVADNGNSLSAGRDDLRALFLNMGDISSFMAVSRF